MCCCAYDTLIYRIPIDVDGWLVVGEFGTTEIPVRVNVVLDNAKELV